jgi:hypothetical protein
MYAMDHIPHFEHRPQPRRVDPLCRRLREIMIGAVVRPSDRSRDDSPRRPVDDAAD